MKKLLLIGCLFLAARSWAYNVTFIQTAAAGADASGVAGPFVCTLPSVTKGDIILVTANCSDANFSLTDSASTPVLLGSTTWDGGAFRAAYWDVNNAAAGTHTFTWTIGGSGSCDFPVIDCTEYAGQDPAAPIDGLAAGTGTGTALASGNMTTHVPNDIMFSMALGAGGTLTSNPPLGADLMPFSQTADTTLTPYPAGSTANAQWTESGSVAWFSLGILISPPRQPTGSALIQ